MDLRRAMGLGLGLGLEREEEYMGPVNAQTHRNWEGAAMKDKKRRNLSLSSRSILGLLLGSHNSGPQQTSPLPSPISQQFG